MLPFMVSLPFSPQGYDIPQKLLIILLKFRVNFILMAAVILGGLSEAEANIVGCKEITQ